ncbi:hypothetical protein Tco_1497125, partial [Tanacetum coccineum]
KVNAQDLQYQLYLMMRDDEQLRNADLAIWLSLKIKFEKITTATACRPSAIRPRDHDDYQDDDARPEGENSVKRQKTSEHGTYSLGEMSYGQAMEQEPNSSGLGTQEQLNKFDAWMKDVGTDDDEVPDDKVSQELLEHMLGEIDEAQLQKVNYLKSDIIWESRKERLTLPTPKKKASVVHSCQRDPKAPPMTLLNQDLFYLKHGNSGSNKYIMSFTSHPWQFHFLIMILKNELQDRATSRKSIFTAPTITFPGIEKEERFTITSEPVIGLEKYKKDVKYGYANLSPSDDNAEYLRFYEEDIRECLKHRDQTRRWEMYVNGRPLRSRRDRLE